MKSLKNPAVAPASFLGLLLAFVLPGTPGNAIDIDFDSGYSPSVGTGGVGSIADQPSTGTTWIGGGTTSAAGAILVTPNDGATGKDQSAKTQAGDATVKYTSYSFKPSDADLGGTFDPSSSIIDYSFDLKLDGTPNKATSVALRIYLGGAKGAHFDLLTNGALCITSGIGGGKSKPLYAKPADGTDHFHAPPNTYFTVSGTLNYATKTFTVKVDGVLQAIEGNSDLGFMDNSDTSSELNLINVRCADPNWIAVSTDNIKLSLESAPAPPAPAKP